MANEANALPPYIRHRGEKYAVQYWHDGVLITSPPLTTLDAALTWRQAILANAPSIVAHRRGTGKWPWPMNKNRTSRSVSRLLPEIQSNLEHYRCPTCRQLRYDMIKKAGG